MRRTRIVATLGPATDPPGVLEALLDAGVDMVRINFSHGTPAEHRQRIARVRQAAGDRPIAVLADLPGPKLRVRLDQPLLLTPRQVVSLPVTAHAVGDIPVTEPELIAAVEPGQRLLLDDGRLRLRAVGRESEQLLAEVEIGGTLLPAKGLNLPDTTFATPALTPRDRSALATAAEAGVDWLALSFVRSGAAAAELRQAAGELGLRVPVLAKIERPEAVRQAAEIIDAFDGIMVARGDLGVELPFEEVPHIQKELIRLARSAARPVVTATEMLDSMRSHPRPTRAEASDVANAIHDGSDAVMLSGETAVGLYPVEAVACMDRIARAAESHLSEGYGLMSLDLPAEQVAQVACVMAQSVRARAIVTATLTGQTPRRVSQGRPRAGIVAAVADPAIRRQLALLWGVMALPFDEKLASGEDRLEAAVRTAFTHGVVRVGDVVVVLADHPVEDGERVPTMRIVRVAEKGDSAPP